MWNESPGNAPLFPFWIYPAPPAPPATPRLAQRLPDWRTTLPLAQSSPPVWSANPKRQPVPIAGDEGKGPRPDARRRQHRP